MSRPIQVGDFVHSEKGAVYTITKLPDLNDPGFYATNIIDPNQRISLINDNGWKIAELGIPVSFKAKEDEPWIFILPSEKKNPEGISYPFGIPREITDPVQILSIQPGEHYKYLKFHFKFYDFADPNQYPYKNYILNIYPQEVCHWETNTEFYGESVANARYMLTVTFLPENWPKESYAAFLMATPFNNEDVYYWLLCARPFTQFDEQYNELETFSPSFGILLQCILGKYLSSLGYKNIYLDALETNLQYYIKLGYELLGQKEEKYKMRMLNVNPDVFCLKALEKLVQLKEFNSRGYQYLFVS